MSMERRLYLNESCCAVAEDDRLVEYIPLEKTDQTGRIVLGRVERMMPALDAAFVDIGRKKAAFLPMKENSQTFLGGSLRSGDRIPVQIRKEEHDGKGAYLSRDLTIPGTYMLLMPMNRHIGISARFTDPGTRERLRHVGEALAGGETGLVMREAAANAERDELDAEFRHLMDVWRGIREGKIPEEGPAQELLRDYLPRGVNEILRNQDLPSGLLHQLREARNRQIRLPHGGNIVIDPCEALTVIDVNSASDASTADRRATALRTNLEACQEIMIQTRLRNLSGILVLDLIDMAEEEDRIQVEQTLAAAFQRDRIKTVIHGFTRLGLMEMTRRRTRPVLRTADPPET